MKCIKKLSKIIKRDVSNLPPFKIDEILELAFINKDGNRTVIDSEIKTLDMGDYFECNEPMPTGDYGFDFNKEFSVKGEMFLSNKQIEMLTSTVDVIKDVNKYHIELDAVVGQKQVRTNKRKRINKKWLKKYGYKNICKTKKFTGYTSSDNNGGCVTTTFSKNI